MELGGGFQAIILFLFAFTSIIGNYAYAESNVQFINDNPKIMLVFRFLVLVMVYFGRSLSVPLVWSNGRPMGLMANINLEALLLTPMAVLLKRLHLSLKRY